MRTQYKVRDEFLWKLVYISHGYVQYHRNIYRPCKIESQQEIFAVNEEKSSAFCYEMLERALYYRLHSSPTSEMFKTHDIELRVFVGSTFDISVRTQDPQKMNSWVGSFKNNNIILLVNFKLKARYYNR